MEVTLSGIATELRLVLKKAYVPIEVTESGMETDSSPDLSKALPPIETTLLGIVTDLTTVDPRKLLEPISVTGRVTPERL